MPTFDRPTGYSFVPGRVYRMPTHFGPALGPRQGVGGATYSAAGEQWTNVSVRFETDPDALRAVMPPSFRIRLPHVTVRFAYGSQVEWLAGRGYHLLAVTAAVTFEGTRDRIDGDLLLVMWENSTEPMLSGREELGFNTVHADIPFPEQGDGTLRCAASWDGCRFAEATVTGLRPAGRVGDDETWAGDGLLSRKYVPRTGVPGVADADYVTFTPPAPGASRVVAKLTGAGEARFNTVTFEDMPTQFPIVNQLAALPSRRVIEATVLVERGASDLSATRIVR